MLLYINKLDDRSLSFNGKFNVKQYRTIQCEKSYLHEHLSYNTDIYIVHTHM